MADMSKECWELYIQAHKLWKKGQYDEAEQVLTKLNTAGGENVSKALLLGAYVKRSQEDFLPEKDILEKLVASECRDEPELLPTVYSLLGQVYNTIGLSEQAVEMFLCSVAAETSLKQKLVEYSNAIFAAASLPETDDEFWRDLYAGYEGLLESAGLVPFGEKRWQNERLRIGYLSSDFRQHPVAALLWPLVDKVDQSRFQVFCYGANDGQDKVTEAFKERANVWRQVTGWSFKSIAKQINIDKIDILVDLGGHTSNNMLPVLAYRPAKLQMSAIGWVGSSGMKEVDYVLGDEYCTPGEKQSAYVEDLASIKGSHFCFHVFKEMPQVVESSCLKTGHITFGCFNNFSKVTDAMLMAWGRILAGVPGSRLLLKHKLFNRAAGREYTLNRMARLGIVAEQVELRPFSEDYLEQYGDMDIALDTFPYTGGMTTFEALYMGVPVVSLYGAVRGQRFGYSMLMNLGLGELATDNIEDYIRVAVTLGNSPKLVADLRRELRSMVEKSPLMDEENYTRKVEELYMKISRDK